MSKIMQDDGYQQEVQSVRLLRFTFYYLQLGSGFGTYNEKCKVYRIQPTCHQMAVEEDLRATILLFIHIHGIY
jgi:hypothetical protein